MSLNTPVVDVRSTIREYLDRADWRVNANSNQGYSLGGMILNTSGKVIANYWLSEVYPREVGEAHRSGDIHIHDLDMFSGYCAGWSLRALLEEGFNGVPDKIESSPPKHLSSALSQMVNFLGTLQNEWAGAQAFSSFDTYLAPFVKKYELDLRAQLQQVGLCESSSSALEAGIKDMVHGDEAVHVDVVGHLVRRAGELQHRGPEETVKLDDVFSDEVVDLVTAGFPILIE
jgi:anaerobic ribonucleoside-triphosphate reductase